MSKLLKRLNSKNLINPPKWLIDNVHYLCKMGSVAYGVSNEDSDVDIYGMCIPPKHIIFPHEAGVIYGFDNNYERFEQWQNHHVIDKEAEKEYDFSIYNIVKYFSLCADGNPNMIDSLFVPNNCVIHLSKIGEMIRENRKIFLSKKCWLSHKGYAFQQIHKLKIKTPKEGSKRDKLIKTVGYDAKFFYHCIRLILQIEQIMVEGDLDLQRNKEQLKAIRKGEWSLDDGLKYFDDKEKSLEKVYLESKVIPHKPRYPEIKELLLNCLEHHYGSLDNLIKRDDGYYEKIVKEVRQILNGVDLIK